jgi:hypothetical protein
MINISKQQFNTLPKYVKLDQTEMRLTRNPDSGIDSGMDLMYFRDAGLWGVDFKIEDNKIISICYGFDRLNDIELIPITEKEWRKGNTKEYLNPDTKAITYKRYKSGGTAFGWKGYS